MMAAKANITNSDASGCSTSRMSYIKEPEFVVEVISDLICSSAATRTLQVFFCEWRRGTGAKLQ